MGIMRKVFMMMLVALITSVNMPATDFKTYENKLFTIGYPADWEVTYEGDECLNVASWNGEIRFDVTYGDDGPLMSQIQEVADNWAYMKESHGHKVDQKMVREDYALVRSIETDEDDGSKTVYVWFIMMIRDKQCFTGGIQSPFSKANESLDLLVEMLATLSPK